MSVEAQKLNDSYDLKKVIGASTSSGEVLRFDDGRAAIRAALDDMGANDEVNLYLKGRFAVAAASATVIALGAPVYWDASESQAVSPSNALDFSADHYLGVCTRAKASGEEYVEIELNAPPANGCQVVYEFDVADGDTNDHVLLPAELNQRGFLVLGVFAVITEAMVGSSEDQGIVTVKDEDDNTIATLTPTNGATDVVGDIVVGYSLFAATTGDAGVTVPAGKAIEGAVTQQTSGGTPAGKMKVYLILKPLV